MFRTIITAFALSLATPALAHHDGHHGGVAVTEGYARATLPGAPVGGAYVTLTNEGDADDRLMSATSPAAGKVSIHDMAMKGDTMVMTPMAEGVPLPAGATVIFAPSGLHIMLEDLTAPLKEGETVDVTLTFEHADPVTVTLPIAAINAAAAPMHMHH